MRNQMKRAPWIKPPMLKIPMTANILSQKPSSTTTRCRFKALLQLLLLRPWRVHQSSAPVVVVRLHALVKPRRFAGYVSTPDPCATTVVSKSLPPKNGSASNTPPKTNETLNLRKVLNNRVFDMFLRKNESVVVCFRPCFFLFSICPSMFYCPKGPIFSVTIFVYINEKIMYIFDYSENTLLLLIPTNRSLCTLVSTSTV